MKNIRSALIIAALPIVAFVLPCYSTDELTAIRMRASSDPKSSDRYIESALQKFKYMDYEGCIADATLSIQLKPTADKYFVRALARRETGKLLEAEQDLEKSAKLNPGSPNAYAELACLAVKLRHFDKAGKAFDQLFKLCPEKCVERSHRAEMYLLMKKPQEAINDILICMKTDKDPGGRCHGFLGQAYLQLHQYEKAVAAFTFAIEKNQFSIDARKGRAEAYEKMGKTKLAAQERKALEEEFSEAFDNAPFRSK